MKGEAISNIEDYSVSADIATEEVYHEVTTKRGISTLFDRWQEQQPQCKFGKEGICCYICSMGPCRIHHKAPKGICGATAGTIVARNMLRHVTAGTAAYVHQAKQALKTLKTTGEGKGGFIVSEPEKLNALAKKVGLSNGKPTEALVHDLAAFFEEEMNLPADKESRVVQAFAPESRLKVWRKLGIVPGGPQSEILEAMTKTMTHINTDPIDLLFTCLRLSISSAYMGLMGAVTLQDIILGTPSVGQIKTNLGVLDPDTVNILVHGHQPLLATKILESSKKEELLKKAEETGAKGIKVYGSTDVGLELMGRGANGARMEGQIGSWMKQEFAVATGAVDLVALDFNCTIPGLKGMTDSFHTKLVSTEGLLRMEGVEALSFTPERAEEHGEKVVSMAIEAYQGRDPEKINIPKEKSLAQVGFTVEALVGALGGSLQPLIDALMSGKIRGVCAVVGCTNLSPTGRHNFDSQVLTEELIARDILVMNAGCCASDVMHSNTMTPEAFDYCGSGLKEICYSFGIPPALSFGSCTEIHRIVDADRCSSYINMIFIRVFTLN